MRYLFDENAGEKSLQIEGESYRYLFKSRRHKVLDTIYMRNLRDDFLYGYRVESVSKRYAVLSLVEKKELAIKPQKYLHIGWCVVDTKTVEKTLPMLNEMGVSKISFVYCDRSQKNFKIDFLRLKKILINSSQQCGRSVLMDLEVLGDINEYFEKYPKSAVLDFGGEVLENDKIEEILIGCEGGFSEKERNFFQNRSIYRMDTPMVLKSESAVVGVSAICLLKL